ncbi:uncharacterized protein BJ171DRAFT_278901 [Polychytrium aggregatum]|uniref:uncharacterized protein n=1 Tax=Polychytrium aggregatum TaxID=110093 RepID=UPI0022FE0B54|nr:uncharacterized protein BJ171DRAFT_278901 [Polychytrium aggregatum]KAI9207651.1 hypothetical protein BJ171DRAFT_278901 [Polychytrium aggregatum]
MILTMTPTTLQEMDVELEHYNRANLRLETTISELKSKLRMAELNVDKEKAKVQQGMAVIKRFKRDVNNCVQYIQEPAQLMAHVKELFGKYSREWVKDDVEMELDIQEEYARQKQHLRRTVRTLRKQVMEDQGSHKADNLDVMNENVLLIKEINQLRKEMRISKQKEKAAEITLRHFIPATVDLGDAGPAPAAAAPEPLPEAENGPPERLHLPPLRQTVD